MQNSSWTVFHWTGVFTINFHWLERTEIQSQTARNPETSSSSKHDCPQNIILIAITWRAVDILGRFSVSFFNRKQLLSLPFHCSVHQASLENGSSLKGNNFLLICSSKAYFFLLEITLLMRAATYMYFWQSCLPVSLNLLSDTVSYVPQVQLQTWVWEVQVDSQLNNHGSVTSLDPSFKDYYSTVGCFRSLTGLFVWSLIKHLWRCLIFISYV